MPCVSHASLYLHVWRVQGNEKRVQFVHYKSTQAKPRPIGREQLGAEEQRNVTRDKRLTTDSTSSNRTCTAQGQLMVQG